MTDEPESVYEAAWAVVNYAIVTTFNADGDELEGCRLCHPNYPFTHREECPLPKLITKLVEKP